MLLEQTVSPSLLALLNSSPVSSHLFGLISRNFELLFLSLLFRPYLQVLVYWLCELTTDTAIRYAIHVSIGLEYLCVVFLKSNWLLLHFLINPVAKTNYSPRLFPSLSNKQSSNSMYT